MTERLPSYEAVIPLEPAGLRILTDRDGDVWQRRDGESYDRVWTCVKAKMQGFIGGVNSTTWHHLVVAFGPLAPIQWVDQ